MQYDKSSFFNTFRNVANSRGVDFACVHRSECWFIEVRERARAVGEDYPERIRDSLRTAAEQVRDTLAGLAAASRNAAGEEGEFAASAFTTRRWRVAVHLEQRDKTSRLHRQPCDPADATTKLRQLVLAMDPQALVVDSSGAHNPANELVPWHSFCQHP